MVYFFKFKDHLSIISIYMFYMIINTIYRHVYQIHKAVSVLSTIPIAKK